MIDIPHECRSNTLIKQGVPSFPSRQNLSEGVTEMMQNVMEMM